MSENRDGGMGGALIVLGAVAVAVVCCAGPALIAGGALALAGGVLRSGPVLAIAGLVVAAAVAYTLVRARRRSTARSLGANSTAADRVAERVPPVGVEDCCAVEPKRPGRATDGHGEGGSGVDRPGRLERPK